MKIDGVDKSFETKEERLKYLAENKETILAAKKASVKCKDATSLLGFYDEKIGAVKATPSDSEYIQPVISNTNYFDSHQDVHFNGSMTKTASEQNGKVYYVADHELKVDNIIAMPKNVEVRILNLPWLALGKNYPGNTQALTFKIRKDNIIHDKFKAIIERGDSLQNSIRMHYVKIKMGVNSQKEEWKEEYDYWQKRYPEIVNKDKVDKEGLFFGVEELKLVMEGSAVLFGSNDATPTEVAAGTSHKTEPSDVDTQAIKQKQIDELKKLFKNE